MALLPYDRDRADQLGGRGLKPAPGQVLGFGEDIPTRSTTRDGQHNDINSLVAELVAGRDPSIEAYDALPDAADHPLGRIIYVEGLGFHRVTQLATHDFEGVAADSVPVSTAQGTRHVWGYAAGNQIWTASNIGRATHNPDGRVQALVYSSAESEVVLNLLRTQFEAAKGRAVRTGDALRVVVTSVTDPSITQTIMLSYLGVSSTSLVAFESEEIGTFVFRRLPSDRQFTAEIFDGSSQLFANSASKIWTNINSEVFGEVYDALNADFRIARWHEFKELPDPETRDENELVIQGANRYILNVSHGTADTFEGTTADAARSDDDTVWRGLANQDVDPPFVPAGRWSSNPDNVLSYVYARGQTVEVGIWRDALREALGRNEAPNEDVTLKTTIGDATDSVHLDLAGEYTQVLLGQIDSNASRWYLVFRGTKPGNDDAILASEDAGSTASFIVRDGGDTQNLLTHDADEKHWVLHSLNDVVYNRTLAEKNTYALPLLDLDAVPSNPADYLLGRIVYAQGVPWRRSTTSDSVADRFDATVGAIHDVAGARWRGVANANAPSSFPVMGQWGANPDSEIAMVVANDGDPGIGRVAIKKSAYETAKGSAVASGDQIYVGVILTNDSDDMHATYHSEYTGADGERYVVFQAYSAGRPFRLFALPETGDGISVDTFHSPLGNPARPFLTHPVSHPHWVHWNSEAGRRAENNATDIALLDERVTGLEEVPPAPTVIAAGDFAYLDRLPHPTRALPARAVVEVLPKGGDGQNQMSYVSKMGGAAWNGWTFVHEYDASASSTDGNPSGVVRLRGAHGGGRVLSVDGAGAGDIAEGMAFTIGSQTKVHWVSQWAPNDNGGHITTWDEASGGDNDTLNFIAVPVAVAVNAGTKTVTVGFGDGTHPLRVLAFYIGALDDWPAEWEANWWNHGGNAVAITNAMASQMAVTSGGLDAPSADHEYVRIESIYEETWDGGYTWKTLPGLYRLSDYPTGLDPARWRVKLERKNGYIGAWVPQGFSPSGGPGFNMGEVVFDPTAGGLLGIHTHVDGGLGDYMLVIDEWLHYGAMTDRVRYVWATVGNHRTRGDELLAGVTPVVIDPARFNPGVVIHNNLKLDIYRADGTRAVHNWAFNVTGQKVTVGGKTFRVFESLGNADLSGFGDLADEDYVDIEAKLDVDERIKLVRDWVAPMGMSGWDDVGTLITGTPGVSARTKCWVAHDIWHPSVRDINHQLQTSLGGLKFQHVVNQAAYDAIAPKDGSTVYFVDGAAQADRRIYIGSKRWE